MRTRFRELGASGVRSGAKPERVGAAIVVLPDAVDAFKLATLIGDRARMIQSDIRARRAAAARIVTTAYGTRTAAGRRSSRQETNRAGGCPYVAGGLSGGVIG